LEDRVSLGALLADLGEFTDADHTYRQALREYQDVSPFPVAWIGFQLGVLWGELVPEPQLARAEYWYRKAIVSLPRYVKARVHLAEIHLRGGGVSDAEAVLYPAIASGDPEARWRLADVFTAAGRFVEAEAQLEAARSGFERLLEKHLLAFADHGAEFYLGSGNDAARAFELARINVANRPTLRAFKQAQATALASGDIHVAAEPRMQASGGEPARSPDPRC
jgi:tetratricopeptide (TPR) repeat protein